MSTIRDLCDQAAAMAKRLKEDECRDAHTDARPSLNPMVQGWRGESRVVLMIPIDVDRDQALRAAMLCATGYGCDSLALTVDTWSATTRNNPVTGKPWGEREMQDVVINHDGLAKGWIAEGLSTFVVNRAGDLATVMQRYTVTGRDNPVLGRHQWTLEWGERFTDADDDPRGKADVGGMVPEALVGFMNQPTMLQALGRFGITGADFNLDDVEAMAHADCGVTKALSRVGFEGAVMLLADDERRGAILDRSLGKRHRLDDL